MDNPRAWSELYEDRRYHWKGPDPAVVSIAARWRELGVRLIHDLGCGAGRHTAFLQTQHFLVVGSDIALPGLAATSALLDDLALPRVLVRSDMGRMPFADGSFDATVATNVLNHGLRADLQAAIDEIHRTLCVNGEVLLTVLNTWDWRCGQGRQLEHNSFQLTEGPETGILHHFFDEDDLREWLAAFELVDITRVRGVLEIGRMPSEKTIHRDAWQVLARRAIG